MKRGQSDKADDDKPKHDPALELELTELYNVERFNGLTRWAPWEWMVYEFEHGLSRPMPPVYPRPNGI